MAGVSNLSVEVVAKTGDFQTGMQTAQNALSGLRNDAIQTAGSMQLLQGRMDEAGDEAQTAGMKAGGSSGGFLAAASAAAGAEISFSSLSVITTLTLIPAMLALSTVVAPLTAALGGLAVAAGSIVGIGLIGFMGAATQRSDQLKSNFQELRSTVLNQLAPVFDIFAGVLNRLMAHLTDTISELSVSEGVIQRIAGQFESLGMSIINTLPAFVNLAVTLANRFLPPFVRWAEGILPKVPGMMQSLIPIMLQVGNALSPLVQSFIDIGPPMTKFGMTVLNLIIPPLRTAANVLSRTMGFVNGLDQSTSKLVTTLVILAPIVGTLVSTLGTMAAPILAVVAAIGIFVSAWVNGWDKTKRMISSGVTTITNALNGIGMWLVENGPGMVNKTVSIFQAMIRDAGAWIRENGPGITKKAFKLVGKAIRLACLELYNAITGNDDSILRSIIKDSASWMINKGPGILKKAAVYAFDAIIAAGKGLYEGLIGNSLIPDMFEDIASYIRTTAKELLTGAIDTVVEAFKSAFNYVIGTGDGTLLGDVKSAFGDIISWIDNDFDIVGTLKSVFKGAGESVASGFKSAFNSAIPSNISLPSTTIAGNKIGGGSFDLPQLDTGGYIEQGGLAQLHAGEQVVPAAQVDRDGGDGGGDTYLTIENVDARGAEDPRQTRKNAKRGLSNAMDAYNV